MRRVTKYIGRHHVALLALFFAFGGTSYAASQALLPRNSVGTQQVVNNSLILKDFKARERAKLRGPRGLRGLQGLQGVQGVAGAKGDKGDTGAFASVTVQHEVAAVDLADGAKNSYNAFCPAGHQGVAGGGRGDDTLSEETNVPASRPAMSISNTEPPPDGGSFTGWRITAINLAGGATTGIRPEVWVVCVPAPAP